MRNILFIILTANILFSSPVYMDKAIRVAENIIIERFGYSNSENFTISSTEIIQSDNINLIYVFHLDPIGFVLVPSDDRATSVLAYSYESDFLRENMPGNLTYILNLYKSEILDVIETNREPESKITDTWIKYLSGDNLSNPIRDINPLITARFDQGTGWNDNCPEDSGGPNGHALVGCVAVSLTQIMHYWTFPETGQGSHGYLSPYGLLEADYSSAYYDYSSMGDGMWPTDAAAMLLYHAGIAVNMVYGADVSVAYYDVAFSSLPNYFFYKNDIEWIQAYQYSEEEYINLLKAELDNYRPLFYYGNVPGEDVGHAWNIDGYQENQFHMNWGWGGQNNGYFSLNAALDFTEWQGAFINIQPQDISEPRLVLDAYESYEKEGDSDMVINPGEEIALYTTFSIPPIFHHADSIDIILVSEESGITILNDSYIHGLLLSGEAFSNETVPFIIQLDSEITLGKKTFLLNATAESDGVSYEYSYDLEVLVSLNQYGFPLYEASQKTSPLSIDLHNDGDKKIIYGDYNGYVHIINSDGSEVIDSTFPFDTGNQIWGAVASADMDGDGLKDFAVSSKGKHLYIFDANGLKMDYDANQYLIGSPSIGNLDDDAELEVIVAGYSSPSSSNALFVINVDGSNVAGFPKILGEKVKAGVALADFNGNGKDDIVLGTDSDNIYLIYDDGSIAPGFPYTVGDKIQAAPSIADINGLKIIFAGSNDNNFYAINSDGSLRFSITTTAKILNSPALLKYNNNVIVFFSDKNGLLYAVDSYGDTLSGWPVDVGSAISKSVVFSDLNGDGEAEVVAVTEMADVLAYNLDGSFYSGFPMDNEFSFTASPMIIDLDDDGDLEILAGSVNSLVVLDIKNIGNNDGYWNLYRGNDQRTGYFIYSSGSECSVALGDTNGDGGWNIQDIVILINCVLTDNCDEAIGNNSCAGDTNSDLGWNIQDIVILINCVLVDNCDEALGSGNDG